MKTRVLATSLLALSSVVAMGGCIYREKVVPAASPSTVVVTPSAADRIVTYPEGRYELRGDGTVNSPYYWVWVPSGTVSTSIPNPPPLPRAPQAR
jgi:hypothetical protein